MTTFDDRERAFETKYARDEEMAFRVTARRNKLLGQWAATQLGLKGGEADAYAAEISGSLVARVVDEGLVERFRADFAAHGVSQSDDQIRQKMSELMATAVSQVQSSGW